MNRVITLFLALAVLGCSSDDDASTLDLNLVYGQWYRTDLCREQNSWLLNSNGTYESFSSGGIDCNDPAPDTYKFTGTYTITENFYTNNELTRELVIDGTDNSIFDFPNPNLKREIIELTEDRLILKVYIDNGDNTIDLLGEYTYEH